MGTALLNKKIALEDNVVQHLLHERVNARIASGRLFDLGQIKFAALPFFPKNKIDPSFCSHILISLFIYSFINRKNHPNIPEKLLTGT